MLIVLDLVVLLIVLLVIFSATKAFLCDEDNSNGWKCPYGYDNYGCTTLCPMHSHCFENREDAFTARKDAEHHSFLPHIPERVNEDGDWRTVYMDDERYDEREEDELFDDDRDDNGW